jgi:hypothetical protein
MPPALSSFASSRQQARPGAVSGRAPAVAVRSAHPSRHVVAAPGARDTSAAHAPPLSQARVSPAALAAAATATAAAALCASPLPALAILPLAPAAPPAATMAAPAATAAAMAWFGAGAAQAPNPLASPLAVPRAERPPVSEIVEDAVANPPDLAEFLQLHSSGKASKMGAAALEAARAKVGFSRAPSGRVSLFATGGVVGGGGGAGALKGAERFEVRCDMGAPGFLLLR